MLLSLVQFQYFLLFGLFKVSIGLTFIEETGSDVSLVIKFSCYEWSCKELKICFSSITSQGRWYRDTVMTFTVNDVQSVHIIEPKYEKRIFNISISFPSRNLTFSIRNVSVDDTGQYFGLSSYIRSDEIGILISDVILRSCTLNNVKVGLVLPLSALNEMVVLVFYTGERLPADIISICNPVDGTCAPPRWTFPRFECSINRSSIFIILKSVQLVDQGMYAVIGSTSNIIYQSMILYVTECMSTALASDVPVKTTELPNITTGDAALGNTTLYPQVITSSSFPVSDQSLVIQEYFVGGSAVAGIVFVTLICWVLCKRCHARIGNGAVDGEYDTVDVHYYSTIHEQHNCAPENSVTTGSNLEPDTLRDIMDATDIAS